MVVIVVLAILLAYAAVITLIAVSQRRLIFQPDQARPGPPPMGLPNATSIKVTTQDGLSLHCWLMLPATTRPVILYLHGNGGHLGYRAARLGEFARLGWGALLVGYRGYGGNGGAPSERGLLSDAWSALAETVRIGIVPEQIVLWGESLGSGLAVQLASKTMVGAVVLEAPFTSMTDLAQQRLPWAPVRLLLRDRFNSLARIAQLRCPLCVVAGGADEVVPVSMSRRLFDAANQPKAFLLQASAGHNDLGTPEMFDAVEAFLRLHMKGPVPG